ncbi:hypothetical protein K440DRAFT_591806, partial [Wilcoxina mikolae CBS 423.85]
MSACCTTDSLHTGTPTGSEQQIHNLPTYVTPSDNPSGSVIVIIPDMFGWKLPNTRLLADKIARETQTMVYVPDFMFGDSLPYEHLDLVTEPEGELSFVERAKFNFRRAQTFGPWMFSHREGVSWPIINGFFEKLYKAAPSRVVLVAGYSWGGRYALLLTHRERWMMSDGAFREGGFVQAAFCAHPSLLAIPKEITAISRPASFALGDCDEVVPMKSVERIQAGLAEKAKAMVETEVVVYEGAQHGFAIRANLAKPMEKTQFEEV